MELMEKLLNFLLYLTITSEFLKLLRAILKILSDCSRLFLVIFLAQFTYRSNNNYAIFIISIYSTIRSNDDKAKLIADEASKSLTWIHVLNYQTKLQQSASMRNLNTLKNGSNRFKYSEFCTIGFTPILKPTQAITTRLFELNTYLTNSLDVYKNTAQSPPPITDYFRLLGRKMLNPTKTPPTTPSIKSTILDRVRVFSGNVPSTNLNTTSQDVNTNNEGGGGGRASLVATTTSLTNIISASDFSYLQTWPPNFDYSIPLMQYKINETTITLDAFVDFMLTFNWYKSLSGLVGNGNGNDNDSLIAIIAVKDSLTSNKIKYKSLSSKLVIEIHDK